MTRELESKWPRRQRDEGANELPPEDSRTPVQALFAQIAAEESEHLRAGADVRQIQRGDGGDKGDGEAPVPTLVEGGTGHNGKILDQCAGTERDAGEDRGAPFHSQESQQQKGDGHDVDMAAAGKLPQW